MFVSMSLNFEMLQHKTFPTKSGILQVSVKLLQDFVCEALNGHIEEKTKKK